MAAATAGCPSASRPRIPGDGSANSFNWLSQRLADAPLSGVTIRHFHDSSANTCELADGAPTALSSRRGCPFVASGLGGAAVELGRRCTLPVNPRVGLPPRRRNCRVKAEPADDFLDAGVDPL